MSLCSGFITMVRVMVLIAIASVIWTPIGIYVGLRPKVAHFVQPVAQFLAAFPGQSAVSGRGRCRLIAF